MRREEYIDILKGIGIVLVVFGHCDIPNFLKVWIYSFHMPFFFFISGYLYKQFNGSLTSEIKKNCKDLLYPYFVIGVLAIMFNTACGLLEKHYFDVHMLVKRVVALIYGNCIWENNYDYINTLWFLVALFVVKTFIACWHRISNRMLRISIIVGVLLMGVFWCSLYSKGVRLPWCADISLLASPFFVIGMLSSFHSNTHLKRNGFIGILFVSLGSFSAYFNSKLMGWDRVDIYGMNIGSPFLFFLSASFISIGLLLVSKWLLASYSSLILGKLGRLSLLIMATHLYILKIVNFIGRATSYVLENPFVIGLVLLVTSSILGVLITKYFKWVYKYPRKLRMD